MLRNRASNRRRALLIALVAVLVVGSGIALLDRLGQLEGVLRRVEHASPELLALAAVFEALSFAGYVALTRTVFRPVAPRISWTESIEITLAGVVATRLVTTGGVGGIALTTWALQAAGLDARTAARRLGAFFVVLYSVFFAALGGAGAGLAAGLLGGGAPRALALAGAGFSAVVIVLVLATSLLPAGLRRRPLLGLVPDAVTLAVRVVRADRRATGFALAWWTFDVAVLWAAFDMFGAPPSLGVLVLCYFLGQIAQVIPAPGGIGPVEGGMIGAFAACGVPVSLALVAVITYQAISTWLPAAPGLWAYVRLRRRVGEWRGGGPQPAQRPVETGPRVRPRARATTLSGTP